MGAGESKNPARRMNSSVGHTATDSTKRPLPQTESLHPRNKPPQAQKEECARSPPLVFSFASQSDGERSARLSSLPHCGDPASLEYILPSFDSGANGLPSSFGGPLSPPAWQSSPIPLYKNDLCVSPITPMLRSYRMHMSSPGTDFLGIARSPSLPDSSTSPPLHARFLKIAGKPAGLKNYGNTCYCNAVVQLLYHCTSLRLRLLELHDIYESKKGGEGFEDFTILAHVAALFSKMHKANNRKKTKKCEMVATKDLLACVKQLNPTFNNALQHDAHEFAMFVLSNMIETETHMMADAKNRALFFNAKDKQSGKLFSLVSRKKRAEDDRDAFGGLSPTSGDGLDGRPQRGGSAEADSTTPPPLQTIFGGQFASLRACLECEKIVMHCEAFVDLSLEIAQGCSLRRCLDNFNAPELFDGKNKLHCEHCGKAVVAQKSIRLHRLPEYALLVHLKRFRYNEKTGGMTKKNVHVAIPREMDVEEYELLGELNDSVMNEMSVPVNAFSRSEFSDPPLEDIVKNTSGYSNHNNGFNNDDNNKNDCTKPSARLARRLNGMAHRKARFALCGFVTHVGEGPNIGHYFTCVRQGESWRKFDDHTVTEITEREVQENYGVPIDVSNVRTSTAYILLYERVA